MSLLKNRMFDIWVNLDHSSAQDVTSVISKSICQKTNVRSRVLIFIFLSELLNYYYLLLSLAILCSR